MLAGGRTGREGSGRRGKGREWMGRNRMDRDGKVWHERVLNLNEKRKKGEETDLERGHERNRRGKEVKRHKRKGRNGRNR